MALGILVLVSPDWSISTLVVVLSIGLFFMGIRSISLVGFSGLSNGLKVLSVISGILSLILAIVVLLLPGYGLLTLLTLVSFGLMVYGFGRIFLASVSKATVGWARGWMVAVGVVDIILSILVLVLPGIALLTFAIILAVILLVSGAEMIASGAIGRTWLGNLAKAAEDEMEGK
jgi:uncharacterized membrane protein HdeD (DUF308 family)